jgi:hypothetical protein
MRSNDTAAALDRDDDDGDGAELFGPDASGAEPAEQVIDPDADPENADEDLLEAEFGEFDLPIGVDDDEDLEDDLAEADEESDDEIEIELLQELGIDLDAPDSLGSVLDLVVGLHDDGPHDDEVAA